MKTCRQDFSPLVAAVITAAGSESEHKTKKARRAWRVALRNALRAEFLRIAVGYFNDPSWKTVKKTYCYSQWVAEVADQTGRKKARIRKRQDERTSLFLP